MEYNLRILFLEDTDLDVRMVQHELQKAGIAFQLRRVEKEEEFKGALHEFQPDVVLSDYFLPGWTGLDALRLLKKLHAGIPFILITGSISEEKAVECMREGADDYFLKGSLKRLAPAIFNVMKRRSAEREKELALEQLRVNEEQFRSMFENSLDAIFFATPEGVIERANPESCRLLAYTEEEICQRGWNGIVDSNDLRLQAALEEQARTGVFEADLTFLRSDGERFPCEVTSKLFQNKFGIVKSIIIVRDNTERKRSEEMLRPSEAKYRLLFESNPCPMFVFDQETKRILNANIAAMEQYGYSEEEFLSMTIHNLYAEKKNLRREELLSSDTVKSEYEGTSKHRRSGGTIIDVELAFHDLEFEGRKARLVFAYNVTERNRAEEFLRQSERLLQNVLNALPVGVWVANQAGAIIKSNLAAERIWGGVPSGTNQFGELKGWWKESGHRIEAHEWAMARALTGGETSLNEVLDIENLQGKRKTILNSAVPLRSEDGAVAGAIVVNEDIGEHIIAAKALRESEARFRTVWEHSADGMRLTDKVGRIMLVNEAYCRLVKKSREQLIGQLISVTYNEQKKNEEIEIYHRRFETETVLPRLSSTATLWNGEEVALEISNSFVKFGRDEKMLLGIFRDVSDRKRAEEQLENTAKRLALAQRRAFLGSWEWDIRTGMFTWSEELYRIFGQQPSAFQPTYDRYLACIHPDDRVNVRKVLQTAIDEKHGFRLDHRIIRSDGTVRYINGQGEVLLDDTGGVVGMFGTGQDITERKQVEEALRASEDQYRILFENDMTGDFVSTPDGRILKCNSAFARIFGFSSVEEALRCNAWTLYPNVQAQKKFLQMLREGKKIELWEMEARRVDGSLLYVLKNAIGKFNNEGELIEIVGYIFDMTERKLLEEQLLQAQKMESIGTLVGGIAHDYNNILNNILGFITQLKKYSHEERRVVKYAETIEKSATRGAELASQLLSFVRKKNRQDGPVELLEVVEDLTTLAAETFPKMVTFEKKIDPNLFPVLGNQGELYQAFLNLCLNAVDAIKERDENPGYGRLIIEVINKRMGKDISSQALETRFFANQDCVEITVTDDGAGVPEEIRTKIFDPFFTTKERGRGTGLGLAIVYNIVMNHKGIITVESEIGAGTTFRILLPAMLAKVSVDGQVVNASSNQQRQGVVLLVDDEQPMQELGKELLEEQGYHVLIARDGQEAVEIYRQRAQEINLVILDLVMPRLDGGQAFLEMRKINKNVRAFFCTGYTSDRVITSLLEEEQLQALQKPFRPAEFLNLVEKMLETVE